PLCSTLSLHDALPICMIASEGGVVRPVVERYLDSPFFARAAPKSLDRGDFTLEHMAEVELADGARTLAAVSAEAILKAADLMPQDRKSTRLNSSHVKS